MSWKEYEQEVYKECIRIFKDSIIKSNIHIKGVYSQRMRQIDCLVQNVTIDGEIKSIIIDAKYRCSMCTSLIINSIAL